MKGPYVANENRTISYVGNKIFPKLENITTAEYPTEEFERRTEHLKNNPMWSKIAKINHRINMSSNQFFDERNALFTALPLTTRMISSPGAVYGAKTIDYTTDTCPITLKWFDQPKEAFLSESSQIYLELALLQRDVKEVYSIYNSFRKEKADATHLSEFHHIEFEGQITQKENELVALNLIGRLINDLLKKNEEDLAYFLEDDKLKELDALSQNITKVPKITFQEAMNVLYSETKNEKYKEFSLKNFNSWEEIKLTNVMDSLVVVKEFPLLEVPFYHAIMPGSNPSVANNSDIIWQGYREIAGSGGRIDSISELEAKAKIFNLPRDDYKPYFQSRVLPNHKSSAGFGLGWERLLQGILETPYIWSACQFPRGHTSLKP